MTDPPRIIHEAAPAITRQYHGVRARRSLVSSPRLRYLVLPLRIEASFAGSFAIQVRASQERLVRISQMRATPFIQRGAVNISNALQPISQDPP